MVEPNWESYRSRCFSDKKAWYTGHIYGMSGVDRTQFNQDFLGLLAAYLAPTSPEYISTSALQAALKESKTVQLNLGNGSCAIDQDECKWPPGVILGLRLAHQYWLPHVPYPAVREAFKHQATEEDSWVWHNFELLDVLASTQVHKATPTRADPSPRIPKVMHLAIEEIQATSDETHHHLGVTQPLSAALNRALFNGITQIRRFFVIGTLSAPARRRPEEVLWPYDFSTASVLLSPNPSPPASWP